MTDNLWRDLAAPMSKEDIRIKTVQGKTMSFINARVVMNRLDKVVGPANWRDEYREVDGGVVCTLYIRVDGEWVGKSDAGDSEGKKYSAFKAAYSDALKRAASRWGIGRELHGDGTAWDDDDDPQSGEVKRDPAPRPAANGKAKAQSATTLSDEAQALARDTFPFGDDDKLISWTDFIAGKRQWNKAFWPATKKLGYESNDAVHTALGVESVVTWDAGTVRDLWIALVVKSPKLLQTPLFDEAQSAPAGEA